MNARNQRGVALLVALLVVALATLLIATLLDRGQLATARTRNVMRGQQASAYARGLEAYAAEVLVRDENGFDNHDDIWSMPMPPTPVPGGLIGATMIDLDGCFNVNNLLSEDGKPQTLWVSRFRRLLLALDLSPAIADTVTDWLDMDVSAQPAGAEDGVYLAHSPPYRAANRSFTDASELRLVAGINAEAWQKLAPYVCALPTTTNLNLNTATVPVLMTLADGVTAQIAERLYRDGHARWRNVDEFANELQSAGISLGPDNRRDLGVESEYFLASAEIRLDGIRFRYRSLLQRRAGIRVLSREQIE